jgi:predicted 2-oxoglutarate/Fe(II)-dependent dioxygenase YbiX
MTSAVANELRARARAGDLTAMTALAKRMLVGDGLPQSVANGASMLAESARRGHADANALLAVLSAWGVLSERNLPAALDSLARAAELGHAPAQRELQLLARSPSQDWPAVRRAINLATWTAAPAVRVVSERPRIVVVEGFASVAECEWLMERGAPHLRRAKVYHGSADLKTSEERTNSEADFTLFNADLTLSLIRDRMAAVARAPTTHFEITKILRYEPGQQFGLHADFLELNTPELVREVELRGQRAATLLVYLNDDYEGGETHFPRVDFRYRGRRGDALLFSNIDASGAPDYATVHAGMPPTRGQKWILSQWIRTKPVTG